MPRRLVVLPHVLFGVSRALRLGQTGWEPTWAAVLAGCRPHLSSA